MEINELVPDIVVCSGDLTAFGYRQEYAEAKQYLERLACETLVVVPGNHDSRNVGYLHFEEQFGDRDTVVHQNGVSVVAIDSPSRTSTTGTSAGVATAGSQSSSPTRRTSGSSSFITICCRSRHRARAECRL